MSDVSNVSASAPKVGGALYRAPKGTTLPTDATTALDAAFESLGYMSADGLVNSLAMESSETKAWGGDVVDDSETGRTDTFAGTLIEALNVAVLKAVFGEDNVTGTLATGIAVDVNSAKQEEACWVAEMILRDGVLKRIVIENGKITNVGDVTYNDATPIGYNVTIKAFANASGSTHKEYIKKP